MLSAVHVFPVIDVLYQQEDNFELFVPEWRFHLSYSLVESLLPVETISSFAGTSSFVCGRQELSWYQFDFINNVCNINVKACQPS
jgi:hypothetical protein